MASFFSSNYRQYKKDTEYIAAWLAATAEKIGYDLSSDVVSSQPQQPTKHKQRARQCKRKTQNQGEDAAAATYRINVGEFVSIAKAIAENDPKIEVPEALTKLFDRAIEARQKAAIWFRSSHDPTILDESNHTHAHFVDILRNAAGLLKPLVKEQPLRAPRPNHRQKSGLDSLRKMQNAFSALAVDTNDVPEDEDAENEPITEPDELLESLPPMNPIEIQHDESEKESDFFFAIQSFLENIHELRDMVQESWFAYKDGKCDFMHASIVANTAIGLVRHAESEFDLLLERPKKYPRKSFPVRVLPALLFMSQHRGAIPSERDFLFPSSYLMPGSHRCKEVHWCLWPAYSGLKYYLHKILRSKDPGTAKPELTTCRPLGGAHKDIYRTLTLAGVYRSNWLEDRKPIDEVSRGMVHMFKHHEIPVWTTFGIQILLDVQDILTKNHLQDPLNELRVRVDHEIATKKALESSWSSPFVVEDGPRRIQSLMITDLESNEEALDDERNNLKSDPIRCGLWMYHAYLEVNVTNLALEGALGQISMMAYIYAASRLIAPESPVWPDMEYLIYQQGPTRVFFGGWPKSLDECLRKAELTMGRSRADEAVRARAKKHLKKRIVVEKRRDYRLFQEFSILSPIFRERILGSAKTEDATHDQVIELKHTLRSPSKHACLAKSLNQTPEQTMANLESNRERPYIKKRKTNTDHPTTLLRDLVLWLEGDAMGLYFSWQTLQDQCNKVWTKLARALSAYPHWTNSRIKDVLMSHEILKEASAYENKYGKIAIDDPDFAVSLRIAHEAIQSTIFEKQTVDPEIARANPETANCVTFGGDVCLARIAREHRYFADPLLSGGNYTLQDLYRGWADKDVLATHTSKSMERRTKELKRNQIQERARTDPESGLRHWRFGADGVLVPLDNQDNSCTDCPGCKRRKFLGHRYPEFGSLEAAYDPDLYDDEVRGDDDDDDAEADLRSVNLDGWHKYDRFARVIGVKPKRLHTWSPDLSGEGLSQQQRQGLKYKLFFRAISISLYEKGRAKDNGVIEAGLDGLTLGTELWMRSLARDMALMYGLEIDLDYTELGGDALQGLINSVVMEKGEELKTLVEFKFDWFERLVDNCMGAWETVVNNQAKQARYPSLA